MDKSRIVWENRTADTEVECKLCKSVNRHQLVLKLKVPDELYELYGSEWMNLYRCSNCSVCFFEPFEFPKYEKAEVTSLNYAIKHYLHKGAGIDFMIKFLVNLKQTSFKNFLDVGCGYGFTLAFVEKMFNMRALGIEPGEWGKLGREALGVNIIDGYIENINFNEKFDVIYSSEVIEHVEDPERFISALVNVLSESGVLVLTTPNAFFIKENTPVEVLFEILFPGYHHIIFNRKSMKYLLGRFNFKNIKMLNDGHRLIVYAYNRDAKVSGLERNVLNRYYYIDYYIDFLKKLMGVNDAHVRIGVAYRLFKEYMNLGKYKDAEQYIYILRELINKEYAIDILSKDIMLWLEGFDNMDGLEKISQAIPFNLAGIFYYLGIIYMNYYSNYEESAKFFNNSFALIDRLTKLFAPRLEFLLEDLDLFWRAKYHEALSRSYQSISIANFILSNIGRGNYPVEPPEDVIDRAKQLINSNIAKELKVRKVKLFIKNGVKDLTTKILPRIHGVFQK